MRGKKGPIPEPLQTEDPTAEEIVGAENIVDVGDVDETIEALRDVPPAGYKCADCTFTSNALSEIEEHCNGTQHGGYGTVKAQQPELFSEPGVLHRNVEVPIDPAVLIEKRAELSVLYQEALDVKAKKKAADTAFNAELSAIDEDMQAIARVLKTPYTYERVDCEWRIIENENARGLYRLDTGEQIDKQPLTAEDRAKELEKAEAQNATPAMAEV